MRFDQRTHHPSSQASTRNPDNPTYPSNLSAALYELGDYPAAIRAILRAFRIIAPDDQIADTSVHVQLAKKVSIRLVKALLHGSRSRKVPDNVISWPANQNTFNVLERIVFDDSNATKLWGAWNGVSKEKPDDTFKVKQTLLGRRLRFR
jgi:hypothetical protein